MLLPQRNRQDGLCYHRWNDIQVHSKYTCTWCGVTLTANHIRSKEDLLSKKGLVYVLDTLANEYLSELSEGDLPCGVTQGRDT